MSKMDELRALREARYERTVARAATKPASAATSPRATSPRATTPAQRPAPAPEVQPPATEAELCGHRSMNGRTCTREHGHAAKSHRYS